MMLRGRAIAILVLVVGGVLVAHGAIGYFLVLPRFAALEQEEARRNVRRIEGAFRHEIDEVARGCLDWSAWDETYDFLATRSESYVRSTLVPTVFDDLQLNLIHFYDADGRLVWGQIRGGDGKPLVLPGLPASGFAPDSPLVCRRSPDDRLSGLLRLGENVLLIASCPAVRSSHEGPVRGAVVHGRLLSPEVVERMRRQTAISFDVQPFDAARLPPGYSADDAAAGEVWLDAARQDLLLSHSVLRGIDREPALLVRGEMLRKTMAAGREVIGLSIGLIELTSVFVLVFAWWAFHRWVLRPMQRLMRHVGVSDPDRSEFARLLRTETAVRRSEAMFHGLIDAMHEGVVVVNPQTGQVLDANRAFCQLIEARRAEMMGRPVDEFLRVAVPAEAAETDFAQADEPGYALRRDGTRLSVHVRSKTVNDGGSRFRMFAVQPAGEPCVVGG